MTHHQQIPQNLTQLERTNGQTVRQTKMTLVGQTLCLKFGIPPQIGPIQTRNREIISLNGLFVSCFGIQSNKLRRGNTITRMREQFEFHQRMNGAYVEHHSPKMPIIHYNTVDGPFMFPIPGDLTGAYFN